MTGSKLHNSKQISVLHVASGDLWAGAEVQLFTLAKELEKSADVSVSVILLQHGTLECKLKDNGINVHVIDETIFSAPQILKRLARKVKELNPDIVHTHRSKENILGSIAAFVTDRKSSLRTTHGAVENPPRNLFHLRKILIYLIDRFCGLFLQKRIIAVSHDLATILARYYPRSKISVIENGIDFEELLRQTQPASTPMATNHNIYHVCFAGRLVRIKRVDLIIRTARLIIDNHPDLQIIFHIFGDGPLLEELKILSESLKTDRIVVFEGHHSIIADKLLNMDTLLITSDHEGLPMIALEAMALGVPIISHSTGGITKLLENGNCGLLVNEQEPLAYAAALNQLASSPHKRAILSARALERLKENYSSTRNAQKYITIYKELADHA